MNTRVGRLALAALFGVLAGIALALVLERFDTRIRSKEAAERHFHLPVLSEIPTIRSSKNSVVTAVRPFSRAADAFRSLRAELVNAASKRNGEGATIAGGKTILVTSPGSAEGKTTVVANLAACFSELGQRVLVLSCDFRRPAIHRMFGVPSAPGLSEALASANGGSVLNEYAPLDGIGVIPSGRAAGPPGELLSSKSMRTALAQARRMADVVLLDTAPLLAGSDPAPLLSQVDAVLVVARAGKTTREIAEWSTEILLRLQAPVVGVALNRSNAGSGFKAGYGPRESSKLGGFPHLLRHSRAR